MQKCKLKTIPYPKLSHLGKEQQPRDADVALCYSGPSQAQEQPQSPLGTSPSVWGRRGPSLPLLPTPGSRGLSTREVSQESSLDLFAC